MKLTWTDNVDDEIWQYGTFDTQEECILDAIRNYEYKVGDAIAIGECVPVPLFADVDSMLEKLETDMYEEVGEVSENWDISNHNGDAVRVQALNKLEEKVNKAMMEYLEEIHEVPNFYTIRNICEVKITESNLQNVEKLMSALEGMMIAREN